MKEPRFWVVRIPKGQDIVEKVRKKKLVAIGFGIENSIVGVTDREKLKLMYRSARPQAKERRVNLAAGQLFRFAYAIGDGDCVLTPDRDKRTVLFGRVIGGYELIPDALGKGYSHVRKVQWLGEFSRDDMSTSLRNSMGGISTVFNLDKHRNEFLKLMRQPERGLETEEEDETEIVPFYDETKAKADELITDMIAGIDPYDFQELRRATPSYGL